MNDDHGSISGWIGEAKEGNRDAAEQLWHRYYARLVQLARTQLVSANRRVADEEDVALSAFDTFYRSAEQGKIPDLADRNGLWRLLVRITANKVIDLQRKLNRQRRGGGRVRGESAFCNRFGEDLGALAQFVGDEPTPAFIAEMTELVDRMLSLLDDEELANMAVARMEGHSNREIAEMFNRSERTVERRIQLIRAKLESEIAD